MTFLTNPVNGVQSTDNTTTSNIPGSSTLSGAINASVTTITLASTAEFPSGGGSAKIGAEYITYTGVSGSDLTGVTRGAFNSTADSHDSGVAISGIYIGTSDQSAQPDVGVSLKSDVAGTIYFDFSNDDTLWDSFPVSGFTVTANIHEFHTAVKLPRYFRVRFESSSSSASTSFRVYTYFGVFRQGNLPLNQSIANDSDSSIVRAILTGADPLGVYGNQKRSGYANTYVTPLTNGTTFTGPLTDLVDYSQVQFEFYADQTGSFVGRWYDDVDKTRLVRTFTQPYNISNTLVSQTASAITRYLEYDFTNDSGTDQTEFYIGLKLYNGAISAQTLSIEGFIPSSMIANLDRSVVVGKTPSGVYENSRQDGYIFSNTTALDASGVFNSGILDLEGYTQLQTELYADQDGTLVGTWYADSAGSVTIRTFTFPYDASSSDLETFSSLTFARYLRYTYTNGGSAQTDFYLGLKLLTKPLSGQILGVESFISNNMIANLGRNVIVAKTTAGGFENIKSTDNNELLVSGGERDIFGTNIQTQYTPIVQSYQLYGIVSAPQLYEQFTATGGTILASDDGTSSNLAITSSIGSYAILRSKRVLKYRPGYSMNTKFSVMFDSANATANSLQFVGVGNSQSDIYFCYNGTDFGIRYSTSGQLEVHKFVVTTAASGTETGNVTLNNTSYNVPLTNAGGDTAFTAHQIETGNSYGGIWNVEHIGSNIFFIGGSVGARSGVYEFSSATAVASNTKVKTGAALTTTNIAQSNWNGPSDMVTLLDPGKMNMYEIDYGWYGVSNILFKIYNPSSSRYEEVHKFSFANDALQPSLTAPNMYVQRGLASLGSTTPMRIYSTGTFGAIIGKVDTSIGPGSAASSEKTISANTETVILTLSNRKQINGFANQSEIFLDKLSVSADGNKSVTFKIYKNPTTLGADTTADYTNYQYNDEVSSLLLYDTTIDTYTGGSFIFSATIAKSGSELFNLAPRELFIGRTDLIIITAKSTAVSDISISMTTLEDY